MLTRLLKSRSIARSLTQTRVYCQSTAAADEKKDDSANNLPQPNFKPPELKSFEFEPFKFRHEKEALAYGYSIDELYGTRYGYKHSEGVRREIRKDTIILIILSSLSVVYFMRWREETFQLQQNWNNYIVHDLTVVRPIPDSVKKE